MSEKYLLDAKQGLLNAMGTESMWGWSPGVDFIDLLAKARGGIADRPGIGGAASGTSTAAAAPEEEEEEERQEQKPEVMTNTNNTDPAPSTTTAAAATATPLDDFDAMLAEVDADIQKKDAAAAGGAAPTDGHHHCIPAGKPSPPEDLHILLLGSGDIRHVLQTVSKLRRKRSADNASLVQGKVHLYIYEPNLRVHCRHVALLQLLFEQLTLDKLEDRVSVFLEVFGNTLIRDITAMHLKGAVSRALALLGYDRGDLAGFLDFSEMKLKERDFIEGQLRHWLSDSSSFPVTEQWDHRVRTELAERYDNKTNIIDWDFHMNLMEYTHTVKFPEYREWRVTGQAFDYARINPRKEFKYDYTVPNKSFAHFNRQGKGVYNGDVKYGPFYALGCDTENQELLTRGVEGQVKCGNGTIAMHNVRAWVYELATAQEWPFADHKFAWDDPANYNQLPPDAPRFAEYEPKMPNAAIHFVGLDFERFLLRMRAVSSSEPRRFDAVFVGCNCAHLVNSDLLGMVHPDGVVVAETLKFVLDATDEAKDGFVKKLNAQVAAHGGGLALDPSLTAFLHKRQPKLKERTMEPSAVQQRADERYVKPYQVVYRSAPQQPPPRV